MLGEATRCPWAVREGWRGWYRREDGPRNRHRSWRASRGFRDPCPPRTSACGLVWEKGLCSCRGADDGNVSMLDGAVPKSSGGVLVGDRRGHTEKMEM